MASHRKPRDRTTARTVRAHSPAVGFTTAALASVTLLSSQPAAAGPAVAAPGPGGGPTVDEVQRKVDDLYRLAGTAAQRYPSHPAYPAPGPAVEPPRPGDRVGGGGGGGAREGGAVRGRLLDAPGPAPAPAPDRVPAPAPAPVPVSEGAGVVAAPVPESPAVSRAAVRTAKRTVQAKLAGARALVARAADAGHRVPGAAPAGRAWEGPGGPAWEGRPWQTPAPSVPELPPAPADGVAGAEGPAGPGCPTGTGTDTATATATDLDLGTRTGTGAGGGPRAAAMAGTVDTTGTVSTARGADVDGAVGAARVVDRSGYAAEAAKVLAFARAQLGKPYVRGASGPSSYDCSGLTRAAWKAAGVELPRTAAEQLAAGRPVAAEELLPGDLVLLDRQPGHVGIYAGDGTVIHAPGPGAGVRAEPLSPTEVAGVARPA
ncbi:MULTISPECIES: C40 family peptidase [Streptomyces]|uniref:NlpC/P60 domain-containing protein n=2 Tax=Streptomyces TaxID=1883 RepID=A0A124ECK4_9ACTN|nr:MULTISPECIES: C40 family peptidase [Streptomyces]KUH37971.1 hypothetical protein ATE80_15145 [Streptomyces kanasensis]UUS32575.1 NlpC/P60 family protein [Streptomyces changanensis]